MSADVQPPPQAKYTRYRSVRQAAINKSPPVVNAGKPTEGQNESIQRSMSRYHRRTKAASPPAPEITSMPTIPQHLASLQSSQSSSGPEFINQGQEHKQIYVPISPDKTATSRGGLRQPLRDDSRGGARNRTNESGLAGEQLQRRNLQDDLSHGEQPALENQQVTQEEVARILAEQKRKDLERLEMELAAATTRPPSPDQSSGTEKFGIFTRKRAKSKVAPPKSSSSGAASDNVPEVKSPEVPKVKSDDLPRNIMQGGGGVVPGVDAPKSAVNAGERRVLIRCKQSSINLPITPDTTPIDLIFSAANILSVVVIPSSSILLESYTKLGLERRIRRYEHIRDIMNSWDRDTQNALVIQASDSPNHDFDLDASSVPKKQPKDITVYMYHSQKPGKWSKRYITLLSTGQIFVSKKKDAKVSDKDIVTLCHLTDFDIYTPTTQQLRKNLRPPKKFCYAVKSQQKTNMFLNTERFVHFFSTDDSNLADLWYNACQQWRSWYLVNIKGEGQKKAAPKTQTVKIPAMLSKNGPNAIIPGHRVKISVDENPYTIGSFKPLLDVHLFESNTNSDADIDEEDENRPRQIPFHLRHSTILTDGPVSPPLPAPSQSQPNSHPQRRDRQHPPPVSLPRLLQATSPPTKLSTAHDADADADPSTFAPTSLLGRSYSQRQRLLRDRDRDAYPDGPFTSGPSLLNSTSPPNDPFQRPKTSYPPLSTANQVSHKRSPSTRSSRPQTSGGPNSGSFGNGGGTGASGLHRSTTAATSRHQRPETSYGGAKPLVDLTPKFVEAPQWSREGKGHGVMPPSGVMLVDIAGARGADGGGLGADGVVFRRE